ncbi:uncharacterized protein LOC144341649 [Saccoglossus kowalevskii]
MKTTQGSPTQHIMNTLKLKNDANIWNCMCNLLAHVDEVELAKKFERELQGSTSSTDTADTSKERRFNDMLNKLSDKIGKDDLMKLKQHCHDVDIPKGTLETKPNAFHTILCLKELGKITINNTKLLEELLVRIGRADLATCVKQYHQIH